MKTALTDVRIRTIMRLQDQRSDARPGSDKERITDHAIDLCLSVSRAANNEHYLHYNVTRDARKHLYRGRKREWLANERAVTSQGYKRDHAETYGYSIPARSAEEEYLVQEGALCDAARRVALTLGAWGPEFVELLTAGHSITTAAAEVGVSRATGYRAQKKLAVALTPLRSRELA